MKIEEWNDIQSHFIDKFGWKKGIDLMCDTERDVYHRLRIPQRRDGIFVRDFTDFTEGEDNMLRRFLRRKFKPAQK